MLNWRWSASSRHLASSLLNVRFCILSGSDALCSISTSVTCLASSSHFPFGLSGYLSNFQVFLWTWTNVHEVPGLELAEVSCISFRALQKLRFTSFWHLWTNRNCVHQSPDDKSITVCLWSKTLSIFFFCRIHSSMLSIISFVSLQRKMSKLTWLCSPSFLFAVSLWSAKCSFIFW